MVLILQKNNRKHHSEGKPWRHEMELGPNKHKRHMGKDQTADVSLQALVEAPSDCSSVRKPRALLS